MNLRQSLSAVLWMITSLGGCGWVFAQSDQVFTRNRSTVTGKIVAVTPIQVTVEVQGARREVKVNEIRRVVFDGEPSELNIGRGQALVGKIESAWRELNKLNPNDIQREIVKRDWQFYLAFCEGKLALSQGGDKQSASNAMLAFVRAAPENFHFFEAAELLGDLAVSQQDYVNAAKYYGSIASRAPFPEYRMRGLMASARARVAQGNFSKAQQMFEQVLAINSDTTEAKRQKRLAQVGRGRCLAETDSPQAGLKLLAEIIAKNDPSDAELFGRAYNARGDCFQKAGQPKEALMAYLHVDVLFYSDPEIHAESLYHLSKLWATAKKPDRAVAARNLLDQRYPGSIWSGKK
ncbi:MAG: tetratricopeptide repeat protein [Pirellulales bacterium]|nr:tetratricopeptide repeat protein [Pirellulales bacterium]